MRIMQKFVKLFLAILGFSGVAISVHAAAVAGQTDPPPGVFISSGNRLIGKRWDSGTLALEFPKRGTDGTISVTVRFRAQAGGTLGWLEIETPGWKLDASPFVERLASPLPNRLKLSAEPDEFGQFHEMILDIPYLRPSRDSTSPLCMNLELLILDGRVVDNTETELSDEQCEM